MKKIFLKMLDKNKSDYMLVIFCGTILVSLIYFSSTLAGCLNQIETGDAGDFTKIYGSLGIFIISYVLLFFLLVIVVLDYIRKRSYSYALLQTLGIKKHHRNLFIGAEYAGIVLSSIVIGLLLGIFGAEAMKKILHQIFPEMTEPFAYGMVPMRVTVIIGSALFLLLFAICDEIIACLGIDTLIYFGKKQGKSMKKSSLLAGMGIFLLGIAFVSQWTYWGKVSKIFPTVLVSVGLWVSMIFVLAIMLSNLRKQKRKYYFKILWLNNWYHRFSYHVNLSYIVAVFMFVIFYVFGMKIMDYYPVRPEGEYKYDLVWMANRDDIEFLQKLENTYDVEIETQEFIRVTSADMGEHMGISESQYKKWSGESIELEDDELYVVYQRRREERGGLGIDYGSPNPRFVIGNAKKEYWIDTGRGVIPSTIFQKSHHLKGETDRIFTGIYESSAIDDWHGNIWEAIVVFSDFYYESMESSAEGANLAVMMNISEHYEEVRKEVYEYAFEHSQYEELQKTRFNEHKNLIYESRELQAKAERKHIFEVVSNVINIIILLACLLVILFVKQRCEQEELVWKYQFYNRSGMSKKKQKKYVKREVILSSVIALMSGILISAFFVGGNIAVKKLGTMWTLHYVGQYAVGSMIVIGIISLFTIIIAERNYREIERRNRDV